MLWSLCSDYIYYFSYTFNAFSWNFSDLIASFRKMLSLHNSDTPFIKLLSEKKNGIKLLQFESYSRIFRNLIVVTQT